MREDLIDTEDLYLNGPCSYKASIWIEAVNTLRINYLLGTSSRDTYTNIVMLYLLLYISEWGIGKGCVLDRLEAWC